MQHSNQDAVPHIGDSIYRMEQSSTRTASTHTTMMFLPRTLLVGLVLAASACTPTHGTDGGIARVRAGQHTSFCGKHAYLELTDSVIVRVNTELVINFHKVDTVLAAVVKMAKTFIELLQTEVKAAIKAAVNFDDAQIFRARALPALDQYDYVTVTATYASAETTCTNVSGKLGRVPAYPTTDSTMGALSALMKTHKVVKQPVALVFEKGQGLFDQSTGLHVAVMPEAVTALEGNKHKLLTFGADGAVEIATNSEAGTFPYLCQLYKDAYLRSKETYQHFSVLAQGAVKYTADLELLAQKLRIFFQSSPDPPKEGDQEWSLPVPLELLAVADILQELSEPLNYADPTYNMIPAVAQFNEAILHLAYALHFTVDGQLSIQLAENSLTSLPKDQQTFVGQTDDVLLIAKGFSGRHSVAVADLLSPLIVNTYKIWPFPWLDSEAVYSDAYLVTTDATSYTGNTLPEFRNCLMDPSHGRICSASASASGVRDHGCGSFIASGMVQQQESSPCAMHTPKEVAYVAPGVCTTSSKNAGMLVVLKPNHVLDFACPQEGIESVRLRTGQYEFPVMCAVSANGRTLYDNVANYQHMKPNMTFIAHIKSISNGLLANNEQNETLFRVLYGVGIPTSVMSLVAVLIALFRTQCAKIKWCRICRKRRSEKRYMSQYIATAPQGTIIELSPMAPKYESTYFSPRRIPQSYAPDEIQVQNLALN